MKRRARLVAVILVAGLMSGKCDASDRDWCEHCELGVGLGNTYHYWGETDGLVLAAAGILEQGRYEVGVSRMTTRQIMLESGWNRPHVMAEPYWGISASRRWRLFVRPDWRLFFGFGPVHACRTADKTSSR
jgi:hypothetical protein